MSRGLPMVLGVVVLAGCRPSPRAAADSLPARALPAPTQASSRGSPGQSSVAVEARQVCDTIMRRWQAVRFATAEVRDTIANPVNRDQVHQEREAEVVPPTPACLVVARTDSGIPDDLHTPYWPAPGWSDLWMISADGPDGRMMTYQRGIVRCEVSDSWDGGDDSDTTVVPLKWFAQRTTCWRHNRELIPSDTGHPPM